MKQYLLSIYQPEGTPPSTEVLEKIMQNVGAVREEIPYAEADPVVVLAAAGVRPGRACRSGPGRFV